MSKPRQLLSVNTAATQVMTIQGRQIMTGIGKRSVSGLTQANPIAVKPVGLDGDEQADLTVHGGLSKSVYAYPHEHYAFWQTVRSQAKVQDWNEPLPFGMLGENLTLTGLLEGEAFIGDQLHFPDCVLGISEPRQPCYKFEAAMGFKQAAKMMAQSGYCGFYLSVIKPGTIAAGQAYELVPGQREVSITELFKTKMRRNG